MTMSKNTTLRDPDFKRVYQCANEVLISSSAIDGFPFKAKALVQEQSDIALCTFEKAKNKYHQDIRQFGSDSAALLEMQGANIIFYNQSEVIYRIRFSIVHELGHYLLGHKMNLERDDPLYGVQEVEANCFAAQILMPEQLLRVSLNRGNALSEDFIMRSFEVSREAAQRRLSTIAKSVSGWQFREKSIYDDYILDKFSAFLNRIAPASLQHLYTFEEDLECDMERALWMDTRSRWN